MAEKKAYIDPAMTVAAVVEHYPETAAVFEGHGLEKLVSEQALKGAGRFVKLSTALARTGTDVDAFIRLLEDAVVSVRDCADVTLREKPTDDSLTVAGLLPCPVRLPLIEGLTAKADELSIAPEMKLEAASGGAEWLAEDLADKDLAAWPDVIMSAGFEFLFDNDRLSRNDRAAHFADIMPEGTNNDLAPADLRDPARAYSMIAVVPAVFLADINALGDVPVPRSWEALLDEKYANMVSLPVGDFDLFNALIVWVHSRFGEEGVRKLAAVMRDPEHPAVMAKNAGKADSPAITIMPYFFTKMVRDVKGLEVVWPTEGAVISPIFAMVKKDNAVARDFASYLASAEAGNILSGRGLFTSMHPDVNNNLPADASFTWPGWEYIEKQDMQALITKLMNLFEDTARKLREVHA